MDIRTKTFELINNEQGLASSSARVVFNNSSFSCEATYGGSNVSNGHVLVTQVNDSLDMIYYINLLENKCVPI